MDVEHQPRYTEPRCSIRDLSSELIFMIMDHLPFPTQFDLACTCKRLAMASRGVLERHRNAYRKYRTASDLNPSTVPLLLRSAFGQGDPIAAWHVRSFEVWRDRTSWSEWQQYDLHTPLVVGPGSNRVDFRVSTEEARRYLYWFEEQLGEDFGSELVEAFLAQVEAGHDGLLKALLFAKLERLHDLKFVTRSQKPGSCLTSLKVFIAECIKKEESCDDSENEDNYTSWVPETYFDGDIDNEQVTPQGHESDGGCNLDTLKQRSRVAATPWPIGLSSIRVIAVGIKSGTWMDDNRDVYRVEPSLSLFSHLLRLPSLSSIYFDKLSTKMDADEDEDEDEEEYDYEVLPARSSSVKHIFLHGCCGHLGDDGRELWRAPQNLLTMSIRHDRLEEFDDGTGTAYRVADAQKASLQSLMWYGYQGGYDDRNILGDHCAILDNEAFDHLKRLPAIRQFSCSTQDIELCMEHADTYSCLRFDPEAGRDDDDEQGNIYDEEDHEEFVVRRVATMFPRGIETLVLWDRPDDEDMVGLIERGIAKMIQGGQYENLKAVFLEATERAAEASKDEKLWYQDAVAAGVAAGVDVHTLANREIMQHTIAFVEAPDEYDLVSGLHSGVRPSCWVFDPYLGRRIPPGSTKAQHEALWAKHNSRLSEYHAAEQ